MFTLLKNQLLITMMTSQTAKMNKILIFENINDILTPYYHNLQELSLDYFQVANN